MFETAQSLLVRTPEPGRLGCIISIQNGVNCDAYPVTFSQKVTKSYLSPFIVPRWGLRRRRNLTISQFHNKGYICNTQHRLPIWIFGVSCSLSGDGVLEYLPSVDLLFHRATRDETIDDNVFILADSEDAVHRLGICGWVPAGINYEKARHLQTGIYITLTHTKSGLM